MQHNFSRSIWNKAMEAKNISIQNEVWWQCTKYFRRGMVDAERPHSDYININRHCWKQKRNLERKADSFQTFFA